MLHVWLIPLLALLAVAVCAFYLLVKYRGGTGVRAAGRTLVDERVDEDDRPPD